MTQVSCPLSVLFLSACIALSPTALAATDERDALIKFYTAANGSHWKKSSGWKEAAESSSDPEVQQLPLCSWHGVKCASGKNQDSEGVIALELENNHLSGRITKHLWGMPYLKEVNFEGNNIKDAGFEGFDSLATKAPIESISLDENRLTHVTGISSAPDSLRTLHISSNSFDGDFPEEVMELKNLRSLRMAYNPGIVGTIPNTVGEVENLKELDLSYTSLTGKIPTKIGLLVNLQYLGLDECRLEGKLPEELNDLISLRYLSIKSTDEDSGKIDGPLPALTNLGDLRELYLDGNDLMGAIPRNFLENSYVTSKLVTVSLKNNKLSGKVPGELSRFEKLQLDVRGNQISGIANQLCRQKKWNGGQVGVFGCDAIACPKGTFTTTGRRETDEEECMECPYGEDDAQYLGSTGCLSMAVSTSAESSSSSNSSGSGISVVAKVFILSVAFVVPGAIGFTLRRAYIKHGRDPEVVLGSDGAAPTQKDIEEATEEKCVL
eukprot:CAMPEP_0183296028 /NCGR_PEP_ID=MMETSP0160_2-20130417/3757_1 /TAXON_ID=2839 ORGANISM="Odontella Sinensis, Strain Grunow 1884" /NCGR_SAMPLE_ID=MMETSP0160_2 /ASSEMBLY_ACC=CAM_ASM_000250 /LENGTH=493 /DNA_ID=CAMNT_0025457595 /DNA_START=114 /DNA_END=1595 /DNA_ORIENTATION=-